MAASVHRDILWKIFLYNADSNADDEGETGLSNSEPNALLVTRHQSQVCCYWRSIILNSPSIWRRMINTRHLAQPSGDWRSEVLRRTQDSPLLVSAVVAGDSDEWVTSFLEDNWTRVEELNLYIDTNTPDLRKARIRRILQQPAPILRAFTLRPGTQRIGRELLLSAAGNIQGGSDTPEPFPQNLPALKFLSLENAPDTFNSRSAYAFSGIHTLFLRFSLAHHSNSTIDLMRTLARLPLLKTFGLRNDTTTRTGSFDIGTSLPFSNLDLPNLRSLSLVTNVFVCTTLLTLLKPISARHLHIKITSHSLLDSSTEAFLVSLRAHTESYFNESERRIKQIVLSLAQPVSVSISPKPNDVWAHFFSPTFFLHFPGKMPINITANPFQNCRFDTVTELSLERRRPVESHLVGFLSQFVNVEVLKISILHLESLARRDGQNIPFPGLTTVVLNLHPSRRSWTKYESTTMIEISKWLKSRKNHCQEIKILDLGITHKIRLDAQCLEEVEGLTVRWSNDDLDQSKHSGYICGSGNLKHLHFPRLHFQSQCSLPEFAAHSPEELRIGYMTFGREMSSNDLLKSSTPDSPITLVDELSLLEISRD